MVFHCLSVPYSPTDKNISLCAFVQKVYKFCEEMKKRNHVVYHYGHEKSNVNCTEHIHVTNDDTLKESYGNLDKWREIGFDQRVSAKAFKVFNQNSIKEIKKRVHSKNDILLCFFGFGHRECAEALKNDMHIIEPSIGYDSMFAPIKIFETYAQLHKMLGNEDLISIGENYVNYPGFYPEDFIFSEKKQDFAIFLGRITEGKGARFAYDLCNYLKQDIIFAGPNILQLKDTKYCRFVGFVDPIKRAKLLSDAKFLLCPSIFLEPCNWTAIEAQFSGTPVICTDFGGFTETVENGISGLRCPNLKSFNFAIQNIEKFCKPSFCLQNAMNKFHINRHIDNYEFIFKSLIN